LISSPGKYIVTRDIFGAGGFPVIDIQAAGAVTPASVSGDYFYLVVANNPNDEGSYGQNSSPAERPAGGSPCRPTQDFDCP
jgi:hypothetical protein